MGWVGYPSVGRVGGLRWDTRTILYKILLYLSNSTTSTVQYKLLKRGLFRLTNNDYKINDLSNISDVDIPTRKISPAPTRRRSKPFIKGPIDLEWISRVAHLPGKAPNVGLVLIYLSGLTKSTEDLRLSQKHLKSFNVTRKAANRVLNFMEEAGLVKIERVQGRKHRVTIIEKND